MSGSIKRIDARALKAALHDGLEIALLDAREELTFGERHIFMAACLTLGRIEVLADDMVPRRQTRVVWCDDGGGLGERAARRMADLGYSDVSVLDGGIAAWERAAFRICGGVHVPSKACAEVVEHDLGTPWISADELKALIDGNREIAVFDSRSFVEYHSNSIPTAISVPGAELVYRFKDLVPSPSTMVIVNCGGRTRSIIGAQSLINAGVANKVVSLKDGTMAWHLAGFQVAHGADRRPPEVSAASAEAARPSAERIARSMNIHASMPPLLQHGTPRAIGARSMCSTCAHPRSTRPIMCRTCGRRQVGSLCRRQTTILPPGAPASCSPTRTGCAPL